MKENISDYMLYKVLEYCNRYYQKYNLDSLNEYLIEQYADNLKYAKEDLCDFNSCKDKEDLSEDEKEEQEFYKENIKEAEEDYYSELEEQEAEEFDIYKFYKNILDKYFGVFSEAFCWIGDAKDCSVAKKDQGIKSIELLSKSLNLSIEEQSILEFIWIWLNFDDFSLPIKEYCYESVASPYWDLLSAFLDIGVYQLNILTNENSNLVELGLIEKENAYLSLTPNAIYVILAKENTEELINKEMCFMDKNEFQNIFDKIQDNYNDEEIKGIATGYYDFDQATGGLKKGEVILISSRPAMGKTAFMINLALNISSENKNIMYFSQEKDSIASRLILTKAEVPATHLKTGNCQKEDWEKLNKATNELNESTIHISNSFTIDEIIADCHRFTKTNEKALDCIFVDIEQILQKPFSKLELIRFYSELKNLAEKLGIVVFISHYLGREIESTENKKPNTSYIKDYHIFEKFLNKVIFIYRDEYYNPECKDNKGKAEIILDKNNYGYTRLVELNFKSDVGKFENSVIRDDVF